MRYYWMAEKDQKHNNWLMSDQRPRDLLPKLKDEFKDLRCPSCTMYDHDLVFDRGFKAPVSLRVIGDIVRTLDGFLCVNDDVKEVIEANDFQGIQLKELPCPGWYVVKITCLVDTDQSVYKHNSSICRECGRKMGTYGLCRAENQVQCPKTAGTFFAASVPRSGSMGYPREVFLTEDIVFALKDTGMKGAQFHRLFNEDEHVEYKVAEAARKDYRPKGSIVWL